MKIKKLSILVTCLTLIQGCSMLDYHFGSSSPTPYYDDSYDIDGGTNHKVNAPQSREERADEVPVEMSHRDRNLQSVKPEMKTSPNSKKSNNNVLLPLSGELE
jgi:hypothetical protein